LSISRKIRCWRQGRLTAHLLLASRHVAVPAALKFTSSIVSRYKFTALGQHGQIRN
jgi:hypothetical protein